jgi:uncharacterized membrane protein YgcG
MTRPLALLSLLLTLIVPATATAYNGPIPPPDIVEGQYVYAIPAGYTADGMSRSQMTQLNGELRNLHNPFYVFILRDLPVLDADDREYARSNGFRGDAETLRVEVSNARLLEDLASDPDFDPTNSADFLMAFNPRKYTWHPSTTAVNRAGLKGRGQDPYTAKFQSAAGTRPANYGVAISRLALPYDAHVFDQTDPGRIAERAAIRARRAEARRLQTAQGALDTEILHLSQLLGEKPEHLPADVESYETTLTKARGVRKANDPAAMLAEAETMKSTVKVLDGFVQERLDAAAAAALGLFLKWLLALVLIGGTVFIVVRRRGQQKALINDYRISFEEWAGKVRNANTRWTSHYIDRDDIIGLDNVTGSTKALWDATTAMVDSILVNIKAMEGHLDACDLTFRKGHYFNFGPYKQANLDLSDRFTFDTGVLNTDDLFGSETVTQQVEPASFVKETGRLFKASINGWTRLLEAAKERLGGADEDLPHTTMDWLFEQVNANGIPERWISDHPLFGDDESDATFYATLDDVRSGDPLCYVEHLNEVRAVEAALVADVERLVAAVNKVNVARVDSPFDTHGTTVEADDDPAVTITAARQAEDKLAGLLASSNDVREVEQQVGTIVALYTKTKQQGAEIESAIAGARGAIAGAKARGQTANTNLKLARGVVAGKAKTHRRMKPANDDLTSAERYIGKGDYGVQQAQTALASTRHLDARRLADAATGSYQSSVRQSAAAVAHCNALDAEQQAFESKLGGLSSVRSRYARKMNGYGSYKRGLADVQQPRLSGINDYQQLINELDTQEAGWRAETRRAERAYDAEQTRLRRIREAEEQARRDAEAARRRERQRQADAAAARRRRDSYSSSSSSSSSSFGGGGYGGSSGGFGGGGYGGSSGSF